MAGTRIPYRMPGTQSGAYDGGNESRQHRQKQSKRTRSSDSGRIFRDFTNGAAVAIEGLVGAPGRCLRLRLDTTCLDFQISFGHIVGHSLAGSACNIACRAHE